MKSLLCLLIWLFPFVSASAQQEKGTKLDAAGAVKHFEEYCPVYILENYCNSKGFAAIKVKLLADERTSKFSYSLNENARDSTLYFHYNESVIAMDYSYRIKHLTNFIVYLKTEDQIREFGLLYSFIMGYEESPMDDKTERYVAKDSEMNAVVVYREPNPETNPFPYHAICFVYQGLNFCNK
jgi:hypothetical protein